MATGYGYVVLQKTASAAETIEGKETFEAQARNAGIQIQGYHADNGTFRENQWRNHCHKKGQTLTFASVHAHFENGVAERRIRLLQDLARTMLTEAISKWPQANSPTLWPYAIRFAQHNLNNTPSMTIDRRTAPYEAFAGVRTRRHTNSAVPFGCPAYATKEEVANGKPFHKWAPRSTLGIYLGI